MQTYLELKRAVGDRDQRTEIITMLLDQHRARIPEDDVDDRSNDKGR